MERRQLCLDLATEEERVKALQDYLRPVGLPPRLVAMLCVIVGRGERIQVLDQPALKLRIAKSDAAQVAKNHGVGISPNTWAAAVVEAESRRLLGILRNTSPWTYVLSLDAIARLEPVDEPEAAALAALPLFRQQLAADEVDRDGARSGPVRSGQSARDREEIHTQNPCSVSVPRDRATGDAGLTDRLQQPWHKQRGLRGQDLRAAVATGNVEPIFALYREGRALGWIGDSEDDRHRFFTVCHHVATSQGIHEPMAVLINRVKQGNINVKKCKQASDDWAGRMTKKLHLAEV